MKQTTFYVNPATGNDTASGNQSAPFKTIIRALQQAVTGDRIQLVAGNYNAASGEKFPLVMLTGVSVMGNEVNKGSDVLIEGAGNYISPSTARMNINTTFIMEGNAELRGISVTNRNARGSGVWIESPNAITPTVANCTFAYCDMEGVFVADGASPKILDSFFHENKGYGLSLTASTKGEIRNNLFQKNGVGINTQDRAAPLITENTIRVNDRSGIIISGTSCPVLRNNTIEQNLEDGIVVITQAQPDLGTSQSPGGNLLRGNCQYDLQSTSTAALLLLGNRIDPKRVKGNNVKIESNTIPEPLPCPVEKPQPDEESSLASCLRASSRSQLQATYTPRQQRPGEENAEGTRGIEKTAFMAQLNPSQQELGEAQGRLVNNPKAKNAIVIINTALAATGKLNVLKDARNLAEIDVDTLILVAETLINLRLETANTIATAQKTILEEYLKGKISKAISGFEVNPQPDLTVQTLVPAISAQALMDWAIAKNFQPDIATKSLELGRALSLDLQVLDPSKFADVIGAKLTNARDITVAPFKSNMSTDCVGYLHLERLSFTPAGIERGELVYSVPLSPGEEVNIAHKEWSSTSEEFQRIVTDYLEDYSEEGVAEKSELAESVNSQTQHTSAFNASVTASGEFCGVNISTSLGYNTSDSASKSEQLTRNKTTEITNKASSRVKKEHKISFTVASAAGTEDQKIQKIKNPFPDRPTRVDYYQLIRKWKIDLLRYGVRMTLDLVVTDPGKCLLAKIYEIYLIRKTLENPLDFIVKPQDLSLDPASEHYYGKTASLNGVSISENEKPPPLEQRFVYSEHCPWEDQYGPENYRKNRREMVHINLPKEYIVKPTMGVEIAIEAQADPSGWDIWVYDMTTTHPVDDVIKPHDSSNPYPSGTCLFWWNTIHKGIENSSRRPNPYNGWDTASGEFVLLVGHIYMRSFDMILTINAMLSEESISFYQHKIWKIIFDAVQAKYYENRQRLQEKLVRLQDELGAQDALSLRKKEREELMRGVLVYLGLHPEEYRHNTRAIKLLHHGIEWENMLYILYPYFWADPDWPTDWPKPEEKLKEEKPYWEFKKYLDHPDLTHRAFLKAGSARVVLTIRPGYEDALLRFVNTAQMEGLPPYPYLEIGEEFKAYASTNYIGIPPANPVESSRPLLSYNQKKTWERMQLLMRLFKVFCKTHRRFPGRLEELQEVFPMQDPWDRDYLYTHPFLGSTHPYNLCTLGKNGETGGEDKDKENTDINYWSAESFKNESLTQVQASEDMQLIAWLLEEYFKTYNTYPTTLTGGLTDPKLKALIPTKDAWDNNFAYACPGVYSDYDLVSYGADRKPGGEGENADIPSWAEASLIGTWYEYTPTSAVDIEFDQEMPKA